MCTYYTCVMYVQSVQCMYSLCSVCTVCAVYVQSVQCSLSVGQSAVFGMCVRVHSRVRMYVGRASRACELLFCVNCLMLVSQCMCAVVMCYSVVDVLFVSTYAHTHPLLYLTSSYYYLLPYINSSPSHPTPPLLSLTPPIMSNRPPHCLCFITSYPITHHFYVIS